MDNVCSSEFLWTLNNLFQEDRQWLPNITSHLLLYSILIYYFPFYLLSERSLRTRHSKRNHGLPDVYIGRSQEEEIHKGKRCLQVIIYGPR